MLDSYYLVSRLILGLVFVIFGLNSLFGWWGLPPMTEKMKDFSQHLEQTKILLPTIKVFEIVFGACLLFNFLPLVSYLALSPILFFIIFAHLRFNKKRGYLTCLICGVSWLGLSLKLWPGLLIILRFTNS